MRAPKPVPTIEEMRSELECVLTHLQRSTSLGKLLSYICEEYFNGRADRLKEYTVAVEAFGRPESFQPKEDPTVRVHAMRLRQHLADYYRGEGRHHRLQIKLPKGGYSPEFQLIAAEAETEIAKEAADLPQQIPVSKPHWRRPPYLIGALIALSCLTLLVAWRIHSRGAVGASSKRADPSAPVGVVSPQGEEIRILAGNSVGSYIDKLGRLWSGDRYYSGGGSEKVLHEPVTGVYDPNLWKYHRTGQTFGYDVPLKPGTYELHLLFSEDEFGIDLDRAGGEGTRVFDVMLNDQKVLNEFDIIRDAGGARKGDERVFLVSPANDGLLHIRFVGRARTPILSGIEIVPAASNRMRPIRIATRTTPYISSKQVNWRPDQYYNGGHQHEIQNPVSDSDDPELFATERFGNFSYEIPVAPGGYKAIMYFSESFFGTPQTSGTVNSRVFDVYFNGTAILENFDIYKEAGRANRVVRKEFHGLHPDALGKLVFTFHPNGNNPSINALEIIPED